MSLKNVFKQPKIALNIIKKIGPFFKISARSKKTMNTKKFSKLTELIEALLKIELKNKSINTQDKRAQPAGLREYKSVFK